MTKVEDPGKPTASVAGVRQVRVLDIGTMTVARMMARLDQEKNLPKVTERHRLTPIDVPDEMRSTSRAAIHLAMKAMEARAPEVLTVSVSSMPSPCPQSCTCPHHAKMRAKLERRAAREARNDRGKRSS